MLSILGILVFLMIIGVMILSYFYPDSSSMELALKIYRYFFYTPYLDIATERKDQLIKRMDGLVNTGDTLMDYFTVDKIMYIVTDEMSRKFREAILRRHIASPFFV